MKARRVTAVDRVLLTVLALLVLLPGAWAVSEGMGWTSWGPDTLRLSSAFTTRSWWPGACAGAALVLILLGLWWLLAHLPTRGPAALPLPGSRTGDRLRVVPEGVARAAEDRLTADPMIHGARLAIRRDREGLVLAGSVRVDARVDLPEVTALLDQVVREAGTVLGADLTGRIGLQVARRRSTTRVTG
ncbi:hypothetical protein [Cellulomonas taurus]|jgi:hypothetical protein|uniref:hypothetical protein n=1 Tax=Cellulomonas taurus TaxID=2729175 RepID=UPI00145E5460|nr:hypothetical protein [Cellulomonas taurus]